MGQIMNPFRDIVVPFVSMSEPSVLDRFSGPVSLNDVKSHNHKFVMKVKTTVSIFDVTEDELCRCGGVLRDMIEMSEYNDVIDLSSKIDSRAFETLLTHMRQEPPIEELLKPMTIGELVTLIEMLDYIDNQTSFVKEVDDYFKTHYIENNLVEYLTYAKVPYVTTYANAPGSQSKFIRGSNIYPRPHQWGICLHPTLSNKT
jgi:hypothetical protein